MKTRDNHILADELLNTLGLKTEHLIDGDMNWTFHDALETVPTDRLLPLILSHTSLNAVHDVLRAECLKNAESYTAEARAKRIMLALMLSQLLEHIHVKHLKTTGAPVEALRKATTFYRNYLKAIGVTVPEYELKTDDSNPFDESVLRETTQKLDFWRLLFIRTRRTMMLSMAVMTEFAHYNEWILYLDKFLGIIAAFHAAMLLPRFSSNIAHVIKHMFQSGADDSALSPIDSYLAQMDMRNRWWEIGYDFGWILGGVLGAFIFVGPLMPIAIYLTVVNPIYNLCLHTARYITEQKRYKALEDEYTKLLETTKDPAKRQEIEALIEALKEKGAYSLKPVALSIGITCAVIVTSGIILVGGMGLWVPFVMAALAVLATIVGKIISNNLPKQANGLTEINFEPLKFPADATSLSEDTTSISEDSESEVELEAEVTPPAPIRNVGSLGTFVPNSPSMRTLDAETPNLFRKRAGTTPHTSLPEVSPKNPEPLGLDFAGVQPAA